jgi:hypothetical protein
LHDVLEAVAVFERASSRRRYVRPARIIHRKDILLDRWIGHIDQRYDVICVMTAFHLPSGDFTVCVLNVPQGDEQRSNNENKTRSD